MTGQQFDLQDSKGNVIYHVEGTMPARTFRIFDQVGNEVFKVTKEVLNAIPTYRFYQNGEMIGILEKQFTLAKDRFQMDIAEGTLKLEEYAGSIGYNYLVSLNDKPIGAVMDDLELRLDNLIFDNSVVIVYEKKYLAMITALAIMVAVRSPETKNNVLINALPGSTATAARAAAGETAAARTRAFR